MKKTIFAVALSALAATSAFAANVDRAEVADPVTYQYGMDLNVKRVISITKPGDRASVVPATMIYEDNQGRIKAVKFRQIGNLGREG